MELMLCQTPAEVAAALRTLQQRADEALLNGDSADPQWRAIAFEALCTAARTYVRWRPSAATASSDDAGAAEALFELVRRYCDAGLRRAMLDAIPPLAPSLVETVVEDAIRGDAGSQNRVPAFQAAMLLVELAEEDDVRALLRAAAEQHRGTAAARRLAPLLAPPSPEALAAVAQLQPPRPPRVCARCGVADGAAGVELKRCVGCRQVLYCSPACHRRHWKQHKAVCQPTVAQQRT